MRTIRCRRRSLFANAVSGSALQFLFLGRIHRLILGREHPVFMDSRFLFVDLLREDTLARKTTEDWQAYLKRYGVDTALVSYPKGFVPASRKRLYTRTSGTRIQIRMDGGALFHPTSGRLCFWDSTALVFARRGGVDAALIPTMEYRYFRPDAYLDVEVALRQGALEIFRCSGRYSARCPRV